MNDTTATVATLIILTAVFFGATGFYGVVAGITLPHMARLGKVALGSWLVVLAAVAVIGLAIAWAVGVSAVDFLRRH